MLDLEAEKLNPEAPVKIEKVSRCKYICRLVLILACILTPLGLVLFVSNPTTHWAIDSCRSANSSRIVVGSCDLYPEFGPCAENAGPPEDWIIELDCHYVEAYAKLQAAENVFMTFLATQSDAPIKESYIHLAQNAFKAMHLWSREHVALVLFNATISPSLLSPEIFPRLTVLHMRKSTTFPYTSIWMHKTRSALVGLMGVKSRNVFTIDLDVVVHTGIDRVFERTQEEVHEGYPYPILTTHWMSRVPNNDANSIYAVTCDVLPCDVNVTRCNPAGSCPNRPMRWGQAGAYTFTHHAAQFMTQVYKNPVRHDDEFDLNSGLWKKHAWKQWCRILPWAHEKRATLFPERTDGSGISEGADNLYFPHGIPQVMIAVHGEKVPEKTAKWIKEIYEYEQLQVLPVEERKIIYYRKKMWTKAEWKAQNMSAEVPCILPI